MNTKLTLSIDKEIIEQAKKYAKRSGRSLSELIENYLKALTARTKGESGELTARVRKLKGSISLEEDLNIKEAYSDYLTRKHQ